MNSWGPLREYWSVNEFLSFVIKFQFYFIWVWLYIHFWARVWYVRGSDSQRNTSAGSGDCPWLTHGALGPCCHCFLPSIVCRGENQSENQTGANGLRRRRNDLWSCWMQRRVICSRVLTPRSSCVTGYLCSCRCEANALMADRAQALISAPLSPIISLCLPA